LRHEVFQDVAARGGAHTFGAEQILNAERQALQRPRFAGRDALLALRRHGERLLGRLEHIGIEQAPLLDRRHVRLGELAGRELLGAKPVARLG
jgi:hypothetical protein